RAEASGFTTAWTSSRSYASVFPYHLVGQLVPQLLGQRGDGAGSTADALRAAGAEADDETTDTWASVIDDVLGTSHEPAPELEDLSPAGKQRILVHAIGGLLRARSMAGPLLLVLDDLQWADPASLAVVEELLTIVPELRVALLATYRSPWSHGWEGRSGYEQVNLRPLRQEDARRLAVELSTGSRISDEITEQVLERSGGNPLFLEELVHGERAVERGGTRRLPASIHEMLLARLDALPPEPRRILQLAAVVGMEFTEPIVADLADTDARDVDEHLRTLQRAELIQARGTGATDRTFLFRHALIHEVAYGSLVTSTRRALHGRVGRWLEANGNEDRVAELAHHYDHSDDRERALRYLRLAGERAHGLNANREAFDWFTAAAASTDDPQTRGELLEAAAQQIYLLGDTTRASDIQRQAIEIHASAGNDRAAANARTWLGRYIWLFGDPIEAQRQNDQAVSGLEPGGPSPELALAYSFRAQSLMLVPDFVAGEHWARRAIEVAEATGATFALVHATNNLGTCLIGRSDARGIEHLRRARELAMEHHLPDEVGRANNNLSGQGARISPLSYPEMDDLLREATAYSRRTIPDGIFDRWIRVAYGEFLFVSGRWEEAEAVLGAIDTGVAEAYLRGEVLNLRGLLLAHRGRYEEAEALTAGVLVTARRVGDLQAVLPALGTEAAIRIGLDDDAGAVAALRDAVERRGDRPDGLISAWLAFEAADAMTRIAGRDPESPALREGLELLASFCRAAAHDVLAGGDLVQVEVAKALFGAAIEQLSSVAQRTGTSVTVPEATTSSRADAAPILDREHRPFDAARIWLWLAEDGSADAGLGDAVAIFDELSAQPYRDRALRIRATRHL
ncbi:MAG: AAA family ATPase, partial [Chloroflexota bacterium]|nr:AAA family ATPase [Chloroflexota bacterium]